MSGSRIGTMLGRELRIGPRSPLVLWAFVLPIVMTLLIRGVFGGLFAPEPRLGIVDEGDSVLTERARELDGVSVSVYDTSADLMARVEANDLDAGLVLPADFDATVTTGAPADLEFFVGGESLASNRIILAVTTLDLIRGVEGIAPPAEVEIVQLGEETPDLTTRLLPLIVMYAVAVAGAFVPAAGLVEEKERRTLDALLVSPASMNEVLTSKGALGVILSLATAIVALTINGAWSNAPMVMVLGVLLGGVMMAEIGLMLGSWARDANTMFTAFKGGGILIFFPVIIYMFPDLPQWIGRIGPSFYFLNPIFDAVAGNAGLGDVWVELVIGLAIVLALIPIVARMGRRLEHTLATRAG
jgi:ABC-2 type transport system permease protein